MSRLRVTLAAGIVTFIAMFVLPMTLAALAQTTPAEAVALPQIGLLAQARNGAPAQNAPLSIETISRLSTPITCTLSTTTTADALAGNNSFASASILATYDLLTLAVGNSGQQVLTEDDYFRLDNAIPGLYYTVEAAPSGVANYNLGLIVYNSSLTAIITDTDQLNGNNAKVTLIAANSGPYYFVVSQLTPVCGGFYKLTTSPPATVTPTTTASPTPTGSATLTPSPTPLGATPIPGADRFDNVLPPSQPNWTFDFASSIALNVKYTNLNFAPSPSSDQKAPDNDYFKVWVKPGLLVTCETLELAAGADTNLILYDNNRNGIGGNDDIDRGSGNFASRVTYYTTYEGWLYALVGNVSPVDPPSIGATYTYSLQCYLGSGPTLTPSPTRVPVTPSPTHTPTPTPIPSLTPTLSPTPPFIQVRQLPTATPLGQASVLIPLNLTVYYDLNNNGSPDPGEGVVGISARVIDVATGQELTHGFTDEFGFASLTVTASGVVRLVVPYLNYSVLVPTTGSSIALRIAPHDLPETIP